ncbi:MAG: ABC-2 family transporter protein [Oscillospiraceae bacterium]|jgi:ABC-2 type transport system permease protein|nr:ABC-2 family transporter protein [Oscillospiraceae bacterium]
MKKYFYIFKVSLIEKMQYLSNLAFDFIFFSLIVFILTSIWRYIYSDAEIINGYMVNQIMWYALLAEAFWFGSRNRIFSEEMSYDIKSGNIACKINKPYNYIFFSLSKYLGDIFLKLVIFILVGIILGIVFIGSLQNFHIKNLPLIALVYVLGVIIASAIFIIISLSSFWLEENKSIYWVYDKIIIMLGVKFPLEMLPIQLQPIFKFTPIFACAYGPMKLTVDFSMEVFYQIIIAQSLWLMGSIFLALFMYKKGLKKINANGG